MLGSFQISQWCTPIGPYRAAAAAAKAAGGRPGLRRRRLAGRCRPSACPGRRAGSVRAPSTLMPLARAAWTTLRGPAQLKVVGLGWMESHDIRNRSHPTCRVERSFMVRVMLASPWVVQAGNRDPHPGSETAELTGGRGAAPGRGGRRRRGRGGGLGGGGGRGGLRWGRCRGGGAGRAAAGAPSAWAAAKTPTLRSETWTAPCLLEHRHPDVAGDLGVPRPRWSAWRLAMVTLASGRKRLPLSERPTWYFEA